MSLQDCHEPMAGTGDIFKKQNSTHLNICTVCHSGLKPLLLPSVPTTDVCIDVRV